MSFLNTQTLPPHYFSFGEEFPSDFNGEFHSTVLDGSFEWIHSDLFLTPSGQCEFSFEDGSHFD